MDPPAINIKLNRPNPKLTDKLNNMLTRKPINILYPAAAFPMPVLERVVELVAGPGSVGVGVVLGF